MDKEKSYLKLEKKQRRKKKKIFKYEDLTPVMAYFFPDEIKILENYKYIYRINSRNNLIRHLIAKTGIFKKINEKRMKEKPNI